MHEDPSGASSRGAGPDAPRRPRPAAQPRDARWRGPSAPTSAYGGATATCLQDLASTRHGRTTALVTAARSSAPGVQV
ncbi:MAG: hypothetical protein AVDCRST_MAG07-1532 [uncultured Frankineae bacterium]|uniref:Uncharacterized protein n=1 Tax=uncultured Frankineae bacterium TaxID=437475 RepID=A0A6J4L811_9ACTN|nr:MAG: hypothetical protein AVDCRST_MAG07-1532 [uncultured Frankineae bacterium]